MLLHRHLDYPKSKLEKTINHHYNNSCSCGWNNIRRRNPRNSLLVDYTNRLLECTLCQQIYQASNDEFELFKNFHKSNVYRVHGNKYIIKDAKRYPKITAGDTQADKHTPPQNVSQ